MSNLKMQLSFKIACVKVYAALLQYLKLLICYLLSAREKITDLIPE